MIVGITGHQRLKNSEAWDWVSKRLETEVCALSSPWVGLSSLAIGTDQLFAGIVLKYGGRLRVIVPNEKYEESFAPGPEHNRYMELLRQASEVTVLAGTSSEQESYLEAGKRIVKESDQLFAVWDGEPAKGLGGTGDIVSYACSLGKRVVHINPSLRVVELK